jgi:hypothetical protein
VAQKQGGRRAPIGFSRPWDDVPHAARPSPPKAAAVRRRAGARAVLSGLVKKAMLPVVCSLLLGAAFTLGERVSRIEGRAEAKWDPNAAEVERLREKLAELERDLAVLKARRVSNGDDEQGALE